MKRYVAVLLPFLFRKIIYYNSKKKRDSMVEKLKINAIYNDFLNSVRLSEEQIRILDMVINKDSIVKISMEIGVSQRTVSYEIKKIKELYNKYYDMQLFKTEMLTK